ncbi:MAG: hypothetical protein AABY64_12055 [Bdellovibrionota bacterium]
MLVRKIQIFKVSVLFINILLFTGCSSDKRTQEQSLGYQFIENGCDTGAKTFTSLESYCSTLLDDKANQDEKSHMICAQASREKEYERQCGTSPKSKTEALDQDKDKIKAEQLQAQKSQELPSLETLNLSKNDQSQTTLRLQPIQEQASQENPNEISLTAKPDSILKVSAENTADGIMSTLKGKLILTEPLDLKYNLDIAFADSTVFTQPLMESCTLSLNQFNFSPGNKKEIDFILIGFDKQSEIQKSGCLAKLSSLALTGFTVEFNEVVSRSLMNQVKVPKVILKVSK